MHLNEAANNSSHLVRTEQSQKKWNCFQLSTSYFEPFRRKMEQQSKTKMQPDESTIEAS